MTPRTLPAPDRHAAALLAAADSAGAAADRAVRRAWAGVRKAIETGGPWVVVYARAREALRAVELAGGDALAGVRAAGAAGRTRTARRLAAARRDRLEDDAAPGLAETLLPAVGDDLIERILFGSGWAARLASLTKLAAPDALAARIASSLQAGKTPRQVAADILPVVQGVRTSAVRTARTAALYVAHEAELATYEGMGADFVVGYTVRAVLDSRTRPEHRKRDGWRYWRNPKKGQRGLSEMPRPPREAAGGWAWNCRCWLEPILAES